MARLTPEREAEIRSKYFCGGEVHYELLEEIDALRVELKEERAKSMADLIGQEHRLGTLLDVANLEIDKLKKRISMLRHNLSKISEYCGHDGEDDANELCDCSTFMSKKADRALLLDKNTEEKKEYPDSGADKENLE